jgi:hypothetical protein
MKNIILIACCLFALSATAQETPKKSYPWSKMKDHKMTMVKGIGLTFPEFEGLNSRMAAFPQYEQLKDMIYTISLGSRSNMKNFITEFGLTAGSTLTGDPDEKSSAARMLALGFDIGYDVIPAERILVYPKLGIGVEKYHAIFYRDVNSTSFNDVANSPAVQNSIRSLRFHNTFMTYRFGLGIEFKSPDGNHGIGIHGGYVGSFKDNKAWRSSEDQALLGAPTDDLQRFSVSLVLSGSMMGMGMHKK